MLSLYVGKDKKLYWKKSVSYVHSDELERQQDRIARGILSRILQEKREAEGSVDPTLTEKEEEVKKTLVFKLHDDNRSNEQKRGGGKTDRHFSSDDDDDEWEEGLDGDRGGGEGKRKGKSKAIGQVRRLHLKPRIKREPPVIRYPVVKVKTKNLLEQFGIGDKLEGRQILLPSRKKVKMESLVPLHLMASAKAFKALQESEEWKKMRSAMMERHKGNTEYINVSDGYDVRCGAYQICTKCANIRTKPDRISSIYKTGKDKNSGVGSLYDTWANSLKELNPYIEMRDKKIKGKQKQLEQKQDNQPQDDRAESPKNAELDFNDAYALLNQAMSNIENSSEKTKRRFYSPKGYSQKFKGSTTSISLTEEVSGEGQLAETKENTIVEA
ncbi:uncharacterized protein LOC134841626 [Symsagittifera roscoffensis]|uniref:uncharacterized protein LOC134841626 n=1 Tax=Symsagittifera roscoffensis TaxID=84072 RepID=UPI00307BD537